MKTLISKAALIDILAANEHFPLERAAMYLGYRVIDEPPEPDSDKVEEQGGTPTPSQVIDIDTEQPDTAHLAKLPYYRLIKRRETDRKSKLIERERQERLDESKHVDGEPSWLTEERTLPERIPLCSWSRLVPLLRRAITESCECDAIDIEEFAAHIAKGETPRILRHRRRRAWPRSILILEDRSRRLIPYWDDHREITCHLLRVLPPHATAWERVEPSPDVPRLMRVLRAKSSTSSSAGTVLLVLGDLGTLARPSAPQLAELWLELGRKARRVGCRPVCLTAATPDSIPEDLRNTWDDLRNVWQFIHLDRGPSIPQAERSKAVERLLGYLADAMRVEPGLLRAVRRLPAMKADAGSEAEFWQHACVLENSYVAATLDQKAAKKNWQKPVDDKNRELIRQVLELWRSWHLSLAPEIWAEEISSLSEERRALTPRPEDKADADRVFSFLAQEAQKGKGSETGVNTARWFRRAYNRLPDEVWRDEALRPSLHRLWQYSEIKRRPRYFRPELLDTDAKRISADLVQQGDDLCLSPNGLGADVPGSPLGRLDYRCPDQILVDDPTQEERPFWAADEPPTWATDYGTDKFGPWVEFEVKGADGVPVTQRMRWIAPGRFLMGSPGDEPGRYDKDEFGVIFHEGPQHEVRLGQGYWLFDTPVTQALWTAVMGDNPSRFKDPKRPVERVSWDDAAKFLERLNGLISELDLGLPTEAQWEYACRAGTNTATYAGPMEILGQRNAPVLDDIAWYGGNSGVEFELTEGEDSSDWSEKQYEHNRAGTHPVGLKLPNAWGLHDMLGNVWEWCADGIREYSSEAIVDPAGPLDSTYRALRGGSWNYSARGVRAAGRNAYLREYQWGNAGFRCARVRAGAELAEPGSGRAGRETAPDRRGGAKPLELNGGGGKTSVELPKGRAFVVRSDCETLTFAPVSRPDWASAMGRDRYGLWAEFTLGEVTQRMCWIGPGRFMMGSPEDEPGRYDSEGPQHEVRLTKGFWLFDTPVTQALWTGVMGDNPSRFKAPKRPVEQVSWDAATQFMKQLNGLIPGLDLVLPTEAQWEYACRAGTDTATYAGPMEILGQRNAPVLDDIAWYGGNSGVEFELEEGHDSSGWEEKQYDHKRAGTHPVGLKLPNAWGLYDMLGNVLEWCADDRRGYSKEAATDPVGSLDGTDRALRGGSWSNYARDVRAAYRSALLRELQWYSTGFRCARVRS